MDTRSLDNGSDKVWGCLVNASSQSSESQERAAGEAPFHAREYIYIYIYICGL